MRSPKLKEKLSAGQEKKDSAGDSKSSDQSKKPRTVHIDVYCTGTELDSDSSSSSTTDNETASTPQTVFESQKMKITHKRANTTQLPITMKEQSLLLPKVLQTQAAEEKDDSDPDDGTSTAYPSQMSSFSAIRDFSSSFSSVPPSWSTVSMSVPDDVDSVTNTSWKDTFSDVPSLIQSRSSIAQTDSLDFVPRKFSEYSKTPSIDETPECGVKKHLLETPSVPSIHGSDSFEYANSEDRFRIKHMDQMWQKEGSERSWRSPHLERKHMLQQKKMQEYLSKRMKDKSLPNWESRETDSDGSDTSGKGWTFVKSDDKKLERDKTVRRASKDGKEPEGKHDEKPKQDKQKRKTLDKEQGSLSDSSSPSGSKSPGAVALRQRLSLDPNLRAPFTIVPGIYTDPRYIANRFGTIVPVLRKPGHHIGPAKNPNCLCDHCQAHFESVGRFRTRSMGDSPNNPMQNWKQAFKSFGNASASRETAGIQQK